MTLLTADQPPAWLSSCARKCNSESSVAPAPCPFGEVAWLVAWETIAPCSQMYAARIIGVAHETILASRALRVYSIACIMSLGTGVPKVDRLSRVGPWGRGVHPTTAEAPRV